MVARTVAVRDTVPSLLVLAALALSLAFYHPFYFGDELFSFAFGQQHDNRFGAVFAALNAYKPRLVMNLLWAAIVALDLPRAVAMTVNATMLGTCAALTYRIASYEFGASRTAALAGAALVLLSRFNVMLYYDYVSGTVESISLAFLLGAIALSAPALFRCEVIPSKRLAGAALCVLLAVLTHERYAAGVLGGCGVYVLILLGRRRPQGARAAVIPMLVALVPLVIFVVLVKALSNNSITMGTSGRDVAVGAQTVKIALTYLANVFLGMNFGPPWFVGALNQDHPLAPAVFSTCGIALALAWALPWVVVPWRSPRDTSKGMPRWPAALILLGAAVALIAVASLPGYERQEARWMFPVFALVILVVQACYAGAFRYVLFGVLAATQGYYLLFGSLNLIASINASQSARGLGEIAQRLELPGGGELLLGFPEPDTEWVLGGSGDVFCRVNLTASDCLYTRATDERGVKRNFGAGLAPAIASGGVPRYRLLSHAQAQSMLPGATLPDGDILGRGGNWPNWTLVDAAERTPEGLRLSRLAENFLRVDVHRLDGGLLVYRARATQGAPVPMRLQVNWHRKDDSFIDASLSVVEVGREARDYPTPMFAPQGAAYGYVYATLHDGARGQVLLESIRIVGGGGAADNRAAEAMPPAPR